MDITDIPIAQELNPKPDSFFLAAIPNTIPIIPNNRGEKNKERTAKINANSPIPEVAFVSFSLFVSLLIGMGLAISADVSSL